MIFAILSYQHVESGTAHLVSNENFKPSWSSLIWLVLPIPKKAQLSLLLLGADGHSWSTCSLHHAPGLSCLLFLHGQQTEALRGALVYLHHHLNNHQHSRVKKAHIQTQIPFFIQKHIRGRCFSSVQLSCSVMSNSLRPHGLQPARLFSPWNFPGKNTGVECYFLLQVIFQTWEVSLTFLNISCFIPKRRRVELKCILRLLCLLLASF